MVVEKCPAAESYIIHTSPKTPIRQPCTTAANRLRYREARLRYRNRAFVTEIAAPISKSRLRYRTPRLRYKARLRYRKRRLFVYQKSRALVTKEACLRNTQWWQTMFTMIITQAFSKGDRRVITIETVVAQIHGHRRIN